MQPRVYSIPASADFITCFAEALLNNQILPDWPLIDNPLSLADGTILLPTQRAVRALKLRLAERLGGDAILPRIIPLGDVDETEDALILADGGFGEDYEGPPAISETQRRLVLATMIQKWSDQVREAIRQDGPRTRLEHAFSHDEGGFRVASSAADTLALASALGRLIDTLAIHDKQWHEVHALVPTDHDEYWEISRKFLAIAAELWPAYCVENQVMDAALRRHRVLQREAQRLMRDEPQRPLIAAGSTGSMPATALLLKAIARLPQGAVILPGLDLFMDEASYQHVAQEPTHPQALLARLIRTIGIKRKDVIALAPMMPRDILASTALRPADTTDLWADPQFNLSRADVESALADVRFIEAQDDREEALAIAIALREALTDPTMTAALVTPDRDLAERVTAELQRWSISIIDTAGQPLEKSEAGAFALLVAESIAQDWDAHTLMALLHHPFFCSGFNDEKRQRAITTLDLGVLRGRAPLHGIDALITRATQARLEQPRHAPKPQQRLNGDDWDACLALLNALHSAFAPLALSHAHANSWARALIQALDDLSRHENGVSSAFERSDGAMLATVLAEMSESPHSASIRRKDLPQVLAGLMQGHSALAPGEPHPRLHILGLIEARLVRADRIILGGLDEGVWPPDTRTDPFLNRAMRDQLKLPAPEKRVGQTAHDFVSGFGARDVILTRAQKRASKPTVPSRLLLRLEAVAGDALHHCRQRGAFYIQAARSLDEAKAPGAPPLPAKIKPPRIHVDPALVPRDYRITEIETLIRDPYEIFARRILELDPLQPIAMPPNAADHGTLIHDVIGRFAKAHPIHLPADARAQLLADGEHLFAAYAAYPEVAAFWRPRFERIVDAYVDWEERRRPELKRVIAETDGRLTVEHGDIGALTLRGRADRIEIRDDGTLAIIDFKTGDPPGEKESRLGKNPQLTLEAAMAARGAFQKVPALETSELFYVGLKGHERVKVRPIHNEDHAAMDLAEDHLERVLDLIAEYVRGERPFLSRVHVKKKNYQGAYDHLARVREWSIADEGDE